MSKITLSQDENTRYQALKKKQIQLNEEVISHQRNYNTLLKETPLKMNRINRTTANYQEIKRNIEQNNEDLKNFLE